MKRNASYRSFKCKSYSGFINDRPPRARTTRRLNSLSPLFGAARRERILFDSEIIAHYRTLQHEGFRGIPRFSQPLPEPSSPPAEPGAKSFTREPKSPDPPVCLLLFFMLQRIPRIVVEVVGRWERWAGRRNKMERMSDVEPGADLRGAL